MKHILSTMRVYEQLYNVDQVLKAIVSAFIKLLQRKVLGSSLFYNIFFFQLNNIGTERLSLHLGAVAEGSRALVYQMKGKLLCSSPFTGCIILKDFFYTSSKSWRGYIFTAVFLWVCVCVCLSGSACEQNSSRTDEPIWTRFSLDLNVCLPHWLDPMYMSLFFNSKLVFEF